MFFSCEKSFTKRCKRWVNNFFPSVSRVLIKYAPGLSLSVSFSLYQNGLNFIHELFLASTKKKNKKLYSGTSPPPPFFQTKSVAQRQKTIHAKNILLFLCSTLMLWRWMSVYLHWKGPISPVRTIIFHAGLSSSKTISLPSNLPHFSLAGLFFQTEAR